MVCHCLLHPGLDTFKMHVKLGDIDPTLGNIFHYHMHSILGVAYKRDHLTQR